MKLIYTGDFEKLKDFGFEKKLTHYGLHIDKNYYTIYVNVHLDDKTITIRNDYYDNDFECELPSVIYDLIQAGLVKKEEEYENNK